MRTSILWLAAAVMVALVLGGEVGAQPRGKDKGKRGGPRDRVGKRDFPGDSLQRAVDDLKLSEKKKEPTTAAVKAYHENIRKVTDLARAGLLLKMKETLSQEEFKKFKEVAQRVGSAGRGSRGSTVDAIVERLMSFDKNKDGKITRDELPERMQDLIAKGDTNKDGALDREEIRKLAAATAREGSFGGGFGGRFGRGRGGRGGFGGGFAPVSLERAVDDLKLAEKKKETATAAVKAYHENVRKLRELARAELLMKLSDVLSEEETGKIKTALDRPSGFGDRPFGRGGPPFRRGRR